MQFRKNRKTNVLLLFLQIFRTIIQYTTLTFLFFKKWMSVSYFNYYFFKVDFLWTSHSDVSVDLTFPVNTLSVDIYCERFEYI